MYSIHAQTSAAVRPGAIDSQRPAATALCCVPVPGLLLASDILTASCISVGMLPPGAAKQVPCRYFTAIYQLRAAYLLLL
jgi:hypothetical protein